MLVQGRRKVINIDGDNLPLPPPILIGIGFNLSSRALFHMKRPSYFDPSQIFFKHNFRVKKMSPDSIPNPHTFRGPCSSSSIVYKTP